MECSSEIRPSHAHVRFCCIIAKFTLSHSFDTFSGTRLYSGTKGQLDAGLRQRTPLSETCLLAGLNCPIAHLSPSIRRSSRVALTADRAVSILPPLFVGHRVAPKCPFTRHLPPSSTSYVLPFVPLKHLGWPGTPRRIWRYTVVPSSPPWSRGSFLVDLLLKNIEFGSGELPCQTTEP
ncbi:hypothetical protein LZ30DRAFT_164248 [Colletotrichum cereale]|nr:hypothetical protein LZ30DRAFT_164248 [Colletotrichum cereale]